MALLGTARSHLTRRDVMKRTLRTGAYAAPVVLSLAAISPVAAATPPPLTQPVTFMQDAVLTGAGSAAPFRVFATPLNAVGAPAGPQLLLGTFTTDRFGVGGGAFPASFDTSVVRFVRLDFFLSPNGPAPPPAATFTSNLVSGLAPVNGAQGPAQFVGLVVQEPSNVACQVGPLGTYTETLDAAILNGPANTAYDFYVQPNGQPAPIKVTTASTNAGGNVTVFAPLAQAAAFTSAAVPTSVVVTAVLAGGSPAAPAFTFTATGPTLTILTCTSFASGGGGYKAIGIVAH